EAFQSSRKAERTEQPDAGTETSQFGLIVRGEIFPSSQMVQLVAKPHRLIPMEEVDADPHHRDADPEPDPERGVDAGQVDHRSEVYPTGPAPRAPPFWGLALAFRKL